MDATRTRTPGAGCQSNELTVVVSRRRPRSQVAVTPKPRLGFEGGFGFFFGIFAIIHVTLGFDFCFIMHSLDRLLLYGVRRFPSLPKNRAAAAMAAELESTSRREEANEATASADVADTSSSLVAAVATWRLPPRDNRRGEADLPVPTTTGEVVQEEEEEEDALTA